MKKQKATSKGMMAMTPPRAKAMKPAKPKMLPRGADSGAKILKQKMPR